jgi:hypothetical protein
MSTRFMFLKVQVGDRIGVGEGDPGKPTGAFARVYTEMFVSVLKE